MEVQQALKQKTETSTPSLLHTCELSDQLLENLPNKSKPIKIGTVFYPSSHVELYRPTGKYISRLLISLFNTFSKKGVIRSIGNACAPGLIFPELLPQKGMEQFENLEEVCPIISVNVLGLENYPQSVTVRAEPFMILSFHTAWKSFDDYLGAFSSKYRVRAKKVFSETDDFVLRPINTQNVQNWHEQCGHLLGKSLRDKTIAIGRDLPRLLKCYKDALGENFNIIGMYHETTLVGFVSYIIDGTKMFAMHLGLEDHEPKHAKLYQRLLFELVHESFKYHAKTLNLGRTGAEIKSTLGAEPLENSFVVFTRSKILLLLFRIYAKYFQKKYHYTYRSPFKDSAKMVETLV